MRRALLRLILPMFLALAVVPACSPETSGVAQTGPGAFTYQLSDQSGAVDSGGGPVNFALSGSSDGVSTGCQAVPDRGWGGSMTTAGGFVGQAGTWRIIIRYSEGFLGDECSPVLVRITDPDGVVEIDTATTEATVGVQASDGAADLHVIAPLVTDPSVTATIDVFIDVQAVGDSLADNSI